MAGYSGVISRNVSFWIFWSSLEAITDLATILTGKDVGPKLLLMAALYEYDWGIVIFSEVILFGGISFLYFLLLSFVKIIKV